MNKKAVVALVVIVVVVLGGGGAYLALRGGNGGSKTTPASTNGMANMNMPSKNAHPQSTAPVATSSVTIQNFAFNPANITVKKGTTVTWTNHDSTAHTVTETDGSKGPDSGTLDSGKSYSFTFDTVGTFHYKCSIHPQMLGTVTVTE